MNREKIWFAQRNLDEQNDNTTTDSEALGRK